jgi:hypothetical protein
VFVPEAYFKPVTSNILMLIRKTKYRLIKTNCISLELIHEMNLLSLINLYLAYDYCSITWTNHKLIRFNRFVS